MKLTRLLAASSSALPLIAQAHPGHDGDHDLVWDFDHLASHPLGTLLCLGLLVAAFWGVRQLLTARREKAGACQPRRSE